MCLLVWRKHLHRIRSALPVSIHIEDIVLQSEQFNDGQRKQRVKKHGKYTIFNFTENSASYLGIGLRQHVDGYFV